MNYLLEDTWTRHANVFFSRIDPTTDSLFIPEFCLMEYTNVIWKAVRRDAISQTTASRTLLYLRRLPLKRARVKGKLPDALAIGINHRLAIYDAVYIALAKQYTSP